MRAGPPWLVCLPFVCSLWNEASPGVLSTQQELFPQSPRAASPWLRPPPALELTGFLKGAWVSLNSSSSSLSEPLPFCMLSRQTSATGMTHQDTEFNAVYLFLSGEEPGAGESQFRGREKGREEDGGQKWVLLSRAFSPLLSSYPPPQVRIVHVGSDILTSCRASRRHCS